MEYKEYKYLTFGDLIDAIDDLRDKYSDDELLKLKIVIMENDAVAICSEIGDHEYHDYFEGFRKCNLAGVVYNDYENEKALCLGFSYDRLDLKTAIDRSPSYGTKVVREIIGGDQNE